MPIPDFAYRDAVTILEGDGGVDAKYFEDSDAETGRDVRVIVDDGFIRTEYGHDGEASHDRLALLYSPWKLEEYAKGVPDARDRGVFEIPADDGTDTLERWVITEIRNPRHPMAIAICDRLKRTELSHDARMQR